MMVRRPRVTSMGRRAVLAPGRRPPRGGQPRPGCTDVAANGLRCPAAGQRGAGADIAGAR